MVISATSSLQEFIIGGSAARRTPECIRRRGGRFRGSGLEDTLKKLDSVPTSAQNALQFGHNLFSPQYYDAYLALTPQTIQRHLPVTPQGLVPNPKPSDPSQHSSDSKYW